MRSPDPIFADRFRSKDDCVPSPSAATHDYATVVYVTEGTSQVEQRGVWTVEAGDAFLVPAGEPHRVTGKREAWGLGFCAPCFAAEEGGLLLAPFDRVRAGASPIVRIPVARRPFLESLFAELKRDRGAAVGRSLLTLVMAEIGAAASWGPGEGEGGVVAESLRFIERRCLEPLTLKDVAAAVGRSPAYVTTALTRATGRSAVAWIVAGRMAEARRRLLHTDEMVDVISERVGYADVRHFTRMFRREHGATPAAWRALQRGSGR